MECQNTIKNLKINKDKSIGEIVIVVEGESEEFRLLNSFMNYCKKIRDIKDNIKTR